MSLPAYRKMRNKRRNPTGGMPPMNLAESSPSPPREKRAGVRRPFISRRVLASCLALILLCLAGCHTTPPLNTLSGRPEVLIQGKSGPQILDVARAFFLNRGYTLMPSDNRYKLSFNRRTEKPGAELSKSNCWRVHLVLTDLSNGSHRLTGTPTKVDDCGGELESEHVIPAAFPQIQTLLQTIKAQL